VAEKELSGLYREIHDLCDMMLRIVGDSKERPAEHAIRLGLCRGVARYFYDHALRRCQKLIEERGSDEALTEIKRLTEELEVRREE